MSLTRKEWEQMWDSIKRIENIGVNESNLSKKINILHEVNKIKRQIQQVIGQME